MNKLFGVHLRKAALIVGSLYVLIFVFATIHASYNLAQSLSEERIYRSECIHIFLVVLSVVSLISSICLIFGSLSNNYYYLLIWLIDGVVILVALSVCLIFAVYILLVSVLFNQYENPAVTIALLVASIILLALKIYIWLGIQQLYKDIREGISRRKSLPSTVPLYSQIDDFNAYAI